ncbi:MAG: glycosyltransferase family 4 protein [Candidatus Aenigmatarchaeota archaeon]
MRIIVNSSTPWGFSGYSQVNKNLIPLLNDTTHHEFIYYTRSGRYSSVPGTYEGVPVYSPPDTGGTPEMHLPALMQNLDADFVLHIMDAWILDNVIQRLNFPQISYAPIDCSPLSPRWYQVLQNIYTVIPYNEFGLRQIKNAGLTNYRDPIYHGVDTSTFKPRSSNVLPFDVDDPFIVGMVKANVGTRANYDHTLEAIKWFLDDNPDARDDFRLYLHTSKQGRNGYNIEALLSVFGLTDIAKFPNQTQYAFGTLSSQNLSEIYSSMDVLLNTTRAEGFGLPILESLSCGTPAIITNGSCMKDVFDEGTFKVDVHKNKDNFGEEDAFEIRPRKMVSYAWPSRKSIKENLEEVYYNQDQLEDKGEEGRKWAQQYDWNKIVPQWVKVLDQIEDETSFSGQDLIDDEDMSDVLDI